ncbi:MAG: ABC transporter substrate-binding protein [Pseudoruegeria sp.]
MRFFGIATLIATLWASVSVGFEIEEEVSYPAILESSILRVISTADRAAFEPIIDAFQAENATITVEYTIAGTTEVMAAIQDEGATYDLVISSAMDLQTKLANDGFAQSYKASGAENLPDWVTWRDQLFAFTQEPAVLVVSDQFFTPDSAPKNRAALVALLRENPETFRGKVGTYDIRRSGFGYLMATQDSRNSEAFWRLMEVMGRLDAQLYCCSGEMIQHVANGTLALAYNVLGSYAASQQGKIDGFHIIQLEDYVSVMLRTALIPTTAQNVRDAQLFIELLLQMNRRTDLVEATGLPAIDTTQFQENSALRPIRFGPGLLVFLDQMRRKTFLRNWESSLVQE